MKISAHQPAYLPWLGYFDKMIRSELFIFLDTVQFEKNSFINRNKIKTPNGACWLTVPVMLKGHMTRPIADIQIDSTKNWRQKHLKSISHNYSRCKCFDELYPRLADLYRDCETNFADLMFEHTLFWIQELQISTKIVRSSDIEAVGEGSELILNLCEQFGATSYISGALGRNYLDEDEFRRRSVEIEYQAYEHPRYPQLHGDFLPNMCIVDFLMNTRETSLIANA